jgi:alpha-tubulin suppressor-like RCC1 family protein
MAFTQISSTNIQPNTVVAYSEYAAFTANVLPKISSVQYADATFTVLDDTAANTSGTARLIINGTGFQTGATVIVGTTTASSTARVNTEQLRANVSALSAGSYAIYVQNPDGGTAIRVNGVTFSNTPVWGTAATLSNQAANSSFNVSISATSDSNITYSNTTSLPAGTSLLSNGYFYGTVTVGVETAFTFDVKATDAENQDNSRTFSLTVTVTPLYNLFAVGRNTDGQLGLNDILNRSSPTQVGSSTWNLVSIGQYASGGIRTDGTLWSWGRSSFGNLGLNDNIYRSSPVQVGAATNWSKLHVGHFSNIRIAIKTDGTLWSWGRNHLGQLGLGNTVYKSSPTQVGTNTNWLKCDRGYTVVHAIKTDNTLWAWGSESTGGSLGNNDRFGSFSSPVQIGSSTDWAEVTGNFYYVIGRKTGGSIFSWGYNNWGQLGLNDIIHRSSPVQIGSNTNWVKIRGGSAHIGLKTDGTLWSWGINNFGSLGLNVSAGGDGARSSPTQIGSSTNWSQVFGTDGQTTHIVKTDGTLWSWGNNSRGQLGHGDTVYKSSPTQVGSLTNWYDTGAEFTVGQHAALIMKKT